MPQRSGEEVRTPAGRTSPNQLLDIKFLLSRYCPNLLRIIYNRDVHIRAGVFNSFDMLPSSDAKLTVSRLLLIIVY